MKYLSLSLFLSILQKSSKIFRNTIGITTLGTRLKDYRKNERKKKKKITTLIKTIPQNSMINGGAIKRERDFSNPSAEPIALLLLPPPLRAGRIIHSVSLRHRRLALLGGKRRKEEGRKRTERRRRGSSLDPRFYLRGIYLFRRSLNNAKITRVFRDLFRKR